MNYRAFLFRAALIVAIGCALLFLIAMMRGW